MSKNNVVLPFTYTNGPVEIGDNNLFGPHVAIGTPGQDIRNPRYDCSDKSIKIGNDNIIGEFTAIQKPAYEQITAIGDRVFLMQTVHIPHDANVEDDVVITPMTVLAGITRILMGADLGMGSTITQRNVIGQYSIVAIGAAKEGASVQPLHPRTSAVGKPLRVEKIRVPRVHRRDKSIRARRRRADGR